MDYDLILSRLDGVKSRGKNSWISKCPAHDDKNPSLSIRETEDGRLLLHCFAGCSVGDIVAAIGVELCNLFPTTSLDQDSPHKPARPPPFRWRDAMRALRHHLLAVQIGTARLAAGDELAEQDLDALGRAALDISTLLEEVGL